MKCPSCGAVLAEGARFCPACGASLTGAPPAASPPDPYRHLIGREVGGRYRVVAKLGEGGMGAVFRAQQLSLKRIVALKVLRPQLSAEAEMVRRFNAEAELAARLSHPNTVTLFDFGQDPDGSLFIAMELIEGHSLRTVVHRGALPVPRAIAIAEQICASLADAHAAGIVHRDLKPDNVMLTRRGRVDDVVRVLDFGIAKLRDDQGDVTKMPMTRVGDLVGTPQYMAPEQIRGETVDARTDVYALGALLYEMVTGQLPLESPSLMGLLSKHLTEVPVPPAASRPDLAIPPALDALIVACLQKAPTTRPASMDVIAEALAAIARQLPGGRQAPTPAPAAAVPSTPPAFSSPPPGPVSPFAFGAASPAGPAPTPAHLASGASRPHAARASLIGAAVLALLGVGIAGWWWLQRRDAERAEAAPSGNDAGAIGLAAPVPVPAPTPTPTGHAFVPASADFSIPQGPTAVVTRPLEPIPSPTPSPAPAPTSAPPAAARPDGSWRSHPLGFAVRIPDDFTDASAATGVDGAMAFTGTIDGVPCVVAAFGAPHEGEELEGAELERGVRELLIGFGATPIRLDAQRRGRQVLHGIVDFAALGRFELRVYRGRTTAAMILFGAPAASFDATAPIRAGFFASSVRPPP